MTALACFRSTRPARRGLAACAGALTGAACLLVTGCSSGPSASSAAGGTAGGSAFGGSAAVHGPAGVPAANGAAAVPGSGGSAQAGPAARAPGTAASGARLTSLTPSQALIRTASLTVRTADVPAAVSRAAGIAQAAGGYVSAEQTSESHNRHTRAMVSIQFKVPPGAYQSTLTALAALGTKVGESQQTQDVTQTVADVTSRVASAQAAIVQLRRLLAHAGTVGGLLTVQDQINQEEASLEALQSQQRALAGETTVATISMVIEGKLPATHRHHHRRKPAVAGFVGGLTAGWHALRAVVATLLTLAGAVLPFAVVAALLALGGYAARRRLTRRRGSASASPEATG